MHILTKLISIRTGLKYRGFFGFHEAEEKSHNLSKWFTLFMMMFFTFGTILLSIGMSMWNLHKKNYDTSTWFLPYFIILPIDKSTIFGWYCELFLQMYSGYAFVLTITSTVTFFGGCSFYIEACQRQLKHMFMELDERIQNAESFQTIEKCLFDAITFHNRIFVVFETVSKIYSVAIFFHLICNVLFFAGAIYQTELVCIETDAL